MTTRSARSLLAIGALLVGATLTSCGDDEPAATAPASSSTPSPSSPSSDATSQSPSPTDDAPSGPSLAITVDGDTISPTNKSLEVSAGDTLTLVVTSDRAGELHVHASPEQELEFGAGTVELPVTLDQPGQVDIEEHESETLVARVLVK